MNNQQRGKSLENRMMSYLQRQGFWVHFMHPAPDGSQPFDLLAINGDEFSLQVLAIDCKTLEGNRFPLDRVEDNQWLAFEALSKRYVNSLYFAVETEPNIVHMLEYKAVKQALEKGIKSLKVKESAYASICIE